MKLTVQRDRYTGESTGGTLAIDDVFECFTLEPRKDQSKGKPYCIPAGTYELVLQYSPHFKRTTPHLLGVVGFTEIEIHPGDFPRDTHGCTLVGAIRRPDFVGDSQVAFARLMEKLLTGTKITYIG